MGFSGADNHNQRSNTSACHQTLVVGWAGATDLTLSMQSVATHAADGTEIEGAACGGVNVLVEKIMVIAFVIDLWLEHWEIHVSEKGFAIPRGSNDEF